MSRRPAFSNPLAILLLCGLCLGLGWSLNGNVAWGGHYSPGRMGDFLSKALAVAFVMLVLWLLVALIRGLVGFFSADGATPAVRTAAPAAASPGGYARFTEPRVTEPRLDDAPSFSPEPADPPQPAPAPQQQSEVPAEAGLCRQCLTDGSGQPVVAAVVRPRLREISVDRTSSVKGHLLPIRWWFDEARSVTVDGRRGFSARGDDQVNADISREIQVTAHGAGACRTICLPIEVAPEAAGSPRQRGERVLNLRNLETSGTFPRQNERDGGAR